MVSTQIKTDARLPRYQQVVDHLRSELSTGNLRPGDKLPSESELALAHSVSLGTVRQAISVLVDSKTVNREQGRGTFVVRPSFTSSLARFFRMADADGVLMRPVGKVKSVVEISGNASTCKNLNIENGSTLIRIERERVVDGDIVLLEDIRLDANRFAKLLKFQPADFPDLVYPFYEEQCGAMIATAKETILVGQADADNSGALGLKLGEPTIVIERLARGFDNKPLEWRRSIGRADAFRYSVELQ